MRRNKSSMPAFRYERPRPDVECELSPRALDRWAPGLMAAAPPTDNAISVFDVIGQDFWTGEGVTAKRVAAALRSIGPENDVVVNINSPGGDLFEGLAIYNLLREHKGEVTVKVLALAASAASIIAMAGDTIEIARAGFLMIHDTWVVAMGNRNDLRDLADQLEPFDAAMASVYSARTGIDAGAVGKMMDAETWINGEAAVEKGFADSLLPADAVAQDPNARARAAQNRLEVALAKAGMTRSERRALIQESKTGTPRAAVDDGTPRAAGNTGTPRAAAAAEVQALFAPFISNLTRQP